MEWVLLILAGLGECFWSAMMKLSDGFSHIQYSILTVVGMVISFWFLILATKHLPLSLAYPIWTGIGAVGSVLIGAFLFKDRIPAGTWIFVVLLIVSIVGIKITSGR